MSLLPGAGRADELDRAEHEQPQNDGRGSDDPGGLDSDVAVNRRSVGVVSGRGPPDHDRIDEVDEDGDDDRRGADHQHRDIELLVRGGARHAARRQVRVQEEPDEQVGRQRQHQPDDE
jgi:hypothetical protein